MYVDLSLRQLLITTGKPDTIKLIENNQCPICKKQLTPIIDYQDSYFGTCKACSDALSQMAFFIMN